MNPVLCLERSVIEKNEGVCFLHKFEMTIKHPSRDIEQRVKYHQGREEVFTLSPGEL